MTTTTATHFNAPAGTLYLALELGIDNWKLAFTIGLGQPARLRTVTAQSIDVLKREIAEGKRRFGLPADAPVWSCYEAGRDGFWIHRRLQAEGVVSHVVDSSSIEVNRRKRRAKNDRLDATKLVEMLVRYGLGETRVWRVVQAPTPEQEDARHLHRELETLQHERRQLSNRIQGLLTTVGVQATVNQRFGQRLPLLQQHDGSLLPAGLRVRLGREFERWQLVHKQYLAVERELKQRAEHEAAASVELQNLLSLRGIGPKGSWILLREGLVWRKFRNRREVGSLAGLTPTPFSSSTIEREQGISKAGNARLRTLLVELSWGWLHYQPDSELTQWFYRRFGRGNNRSRKVGLVALARKLLIALWRFAVQGEIPAGAQLVDWYRKFKRTSKSLAAG